ncbi:RusA family crossover junction endodeoxyribonuclease [Longispora sp. NPDC051575]|uniref:RusA family crossover junction endodeoxyribonuclease n=1 Tax=Longispora sp. NPDC051575 TaxID=3154943 RepID=UPI00344A7E2C
MPYLIGESNGDDEVEFAVDVAGIPSAQGKAERLKATVRGELQFAARAAMSRRKLLKTGIWLTNHMFHTFIRSKQDMDNSHKFVQDCLSGIVYPDDCTIEDSWQKRYDLRKKTFDMCTPRLALDLLPQVPRRSMIYIYATTDFEKAMSRRGVSNG